VAELPGSAGGAALPLALLASSLIPAAVVFVLPERCERLRSTVNVSGAVIKVALAGVLIVGVLAGNEYEWRAAFLPGVDLVLRVDAIPLLFVSLSALLWLTTTVYAIGYLREDEYRGRFFGFFGLCVAATVGIALAGNLVTFLVFFELLTISTYPLIVHQRTDRALAGGRVYLLYTLGGGAVLLVAVAWLHATAGPVEFAAESPLAPLVDEHRTTLVLVFVLLVAGLGVKAAIVPLHGWLPRAMVAPAPVSALLHAVAVVKAGAYGIVRVVYDLYGIEVAADLGVLTGLAVAAAVTIVYGSLRALAQDDLKRRLAYSTVSQLSYIILGISIVGLTSTTGGLVHLVHQGIMKVTLFYCAGNLGKALGVTRVSEMDGVGRRLPVTMAAFTVAAAGMVGIPPTAGFVSKWYLGLGGVEAGQGWVLAVLLVSSALNAAYFLPPVARAWLRPASPDLPPRRTGRWAEIDPWLLLPAVATGGSVVLLGVFAAAFWSPLSWASFIAEEIFGRP
jgi:multicomponent Na+:H+ antiporter subunit D